MALSVSVCTTIFNEGAMLEKCMRSFRAQLEPQDEIIICDAGSSDRSLEIERKYADIVISHPMEEGSPITRGKGRQIATEYAIGDIVVSVDGDCIAPDGYIERIVEYFQQNPEVTLVYGDTIDTQGRVLRSMASVMARKIWGAGGCNSAFRREIFEQIRGYKDVNWWEDIGLYNDFPNEKRFIDNPIMMELDPRFSEVYWGAAFGLLGLGYLFWRIKQGKG